MIEIKATKIVFLLQKSVSRVRKAIVLTSRHPLAKLGLTGIPSSSYFTK
jgi:hypothetical protein